MKRSFFCIIAFLVFFGEAFAQTSASISINFYDKTMYYPSTASNENPVFVEVSIKNTGSETYRFKLADDRMFSLDFSVYTLKNTKAKQTELIMKKRTTNQTVYFREIALEAGETYSFIENVKDYVSIDTPSIYYLELSFYPELYREKKIRLLSNRLTLEINPSPSASSSKMIGVAGESAMILKPEEIAPDKVIEQTIVARQKSLWDQFFLYMDVESMLERNASAKRKYRSVSAGERNRMLTSYKADLMQAKIDGDIVAIPEKFEIEKTVYAKTDGTVSVIEWFNNRTFFEKKNYIYKLRLRDGIWQIYDYTVINLGTE